MMNAYQSAQENTVTRFDIRRLADSLKRKCRKMIVMGHKGKQSLKALHKDRDGFMPLLLLLGPTCVENYSFQLSLAKRIV